MLVLGRDSISEEERTQIAIQSKPDLRRFCNTPSSENFS